MDRWDAVTAAAFLLILSVWIFCPMPFSETYDTPERMVSYLQEGRFFAGNVLTGESSASEPIASESVAVDETITDETITDETAVDETAVDETITDETARESAAEGSVQTVVSWSDSALALPALYACMCSLFGIPVISFLYIVLPVPYLLLTFAVQKELAACFFPDQKRLQSLYILSFALLTVFGGRAYMNTSYGILYFWYEGAVLFSNVVLPAVFLFCLQKKTLPCWILLILDAVLLAGPAKGIAVLAVQALCFLCASILEKVTDGLRGRRCRLWK